MVGEHARQGVMHDNLNAYLYEFLFLINSHSPRTGT